MTDLAILALGEKANVLIDGYGAGDNTSAHLYMGNGIIRLDSAAQLVTVAGTQTLAWDMLQTRSDSTQRHLDSIKTCRPTNCTFGPIFCICTTAVTVCGLT